MRTVPPPLPVRAIQRSAVAPLLLRVVGVAALALVGVIVGAVTLPALRRPRSRPTPVEPMTVAVEQSAEQTSEPLPVPTPIAQPPRAYYVEPQLPSKFGPYELSLIIDREIDAKLATTGLPASPPSDDAEFLRRAFLDIVGKIPPRDRVAAFLADPNPLKRSVVIDELLADPDYGKHFARLWADALVKRDSDSNRGLDTRPFVGWLAGRLNADAGWDEVVREMITAEGSETTPATFFVQANMDNRQPSPAKLTGAVGNLFMGIQLQCAECHKHPFVEKWEVSDFWGVAAFFAHTKANRGGGNNPKAQGPATFKEVEQSEAPKDKKGKPLAPSIRPGLVINVPDPGDPRKVLRVAKGKFLESTNAVNTSAAPYRPVFASWLTSAENRFFAPATVNRLWAHFFARGLVHPVEEMSEANKPTHPDLLRELAARMSGEAKFSVKDFIRSVCNSRAYQRTSRPSGENGNDDKLLSRMPVKILDARQLIDSLAVATGREVKMNREAPVGRRGVPDVRDPMVRALDTRNYDDDPTEFSYGIPQLLKLMNTPLTAASGEFAARMASKHGEDREAALDEVFLTALGRKPSPGETERMHGYIEKQSTPAKGYAGVLWALLNSAEFLSNH